MKKVEEKLNTFIQFHTIMKAMKIGFPNHPRKDILEEIDWIGRNGFDFIDLFLEADRAAPEKINIPRVQRLLQKYGLEIVGHTPWYLPTGSPERAYREFAVTEATRYFHVLSQLNAPYVTIHGNWPSKLFSEQEGIHFQKETLIELVRVARTFNLQILYEPMDTPLDTIENVSELLEGVPGLFLHLDIGHANLFKRKPAQFVQHFHKKLRHVHLHDNDGNRDLHLPMGAGNIDWEELIRLLKKYYNGTITLEIFSREREHVLFSRERLTALWRR
jgi:sugar phosphate isomerase/epimerase